LEARYTSVRYNHLLAYTGIHTFVPSTERKLRAMAILFAASDARGGDALGGRSDCVLCAARFVPRNVPICFVSVQKIRVSFVLPLT
jgi:hypothetical protein